jgi:hypothetical protein
MAQSRKRAKFLFLGLTVGNFREFPELLIEVGLIELPSNFAFFLSMINRWLLCRSSLLLSCLIFAATTAAHAETAKSVTQYGITWTFDKDYPVGQFVTGDWWVIGPVTVVSVTPAPGPAPLDEPVTSAKSMYGAVSLKDDKTYRNGSMVVGAPTKNGTFTKQGYDSRALNFDPSLSISYPYRLPPGQSLISTISSEAYKDGKLETPSIIGMYYPDGNDKATAVLALDTAAVLTCLDKVPPADAFRPAYAGTDKTLYETKDIRWDLLPKLKPVASTPDWEKMARIYQRPWIDHISDWTIQFTAPGQNQAAYGGLVTRMNAYASLMLLLDVPQEQKEKLMIGFLQYGVDLRGLAECGRQWFPDGGHWMGRKWPILFASLMLDKPEIRSFPPVDLTKPVLYGTIMLEPGSEGPTPTTFFSEDLSTYYGKGALGQDVLWRVTFHTHSREPYQEKPYDQWTDDEKFQNNYFWTPADWPAFALSALYLKQKSTWDHDAFFDFNDWFMKPGQTRLNSKNGQPMPTRIGTDKFVREMWDTYRAEAPEQPGGVDNLVWAWADAPAAPDGKPSFVSKGHWIQNPKTP